MDEQGPERFLFGAEESHGYLVGQYARDKDGAVAALLLSELAARVKAAGKSLHEKLDDLRWQHGVHVEKTISLQMPGSEGMQRMQALMDGLRANPPAQVAGIAVDRVRDYLRQKVRQRGEESPLEGPRGDLLMLDLAATGNYVAIRPSGTEPKVKFYMFAYEAPEMLADLDDTKRQLAQRLSQMESEFRSFASHE